MWPHNAQTRGCHRITNHPVHLYAESFLQASVAQIHQGLQSVSCPKSWEWQHKGRLRIQEDVRIHSLAKVKDTEGTQVLRGKVGKPKITLLKKDYGPQEFKLKKKRRGLPHASVWMKFTNNKVQCAMHWVEHSWLEVFLHLNLVSLGAEEIQAIKWRLRQAIHRFNKLYE